MNYLETTFDDMMKTVGVWNFFIPVVSDTGKKHFKATKYLKQYQKTNSMSIFQPNLEFLEVISWIKSAVRTLPVIANELTPTFNALLEDTDLTPVDLSMLKDIKERFT